ncbi:MAG: type II toxin-antitoxin system death-on-curing family toxin [Syntrophomonadaceae bacterium]|nr:type II toxin-antitoxin system death-on-curing family toxin [Syntrophomonadaceae bacterium]
MNKIRFITKKTVLYFHTKLIEEFGGINGIRDEGMLDSALAQAQIAIEGEYLHQDIFAMAAAYGFHLCRNHPFTDGNKRIALVVMDTFLYMNGQELLAAEKDAYITMLELAAGNISKEQLAEWLRTNSRPLT